MTRKEAIRQTAQIDRLRAVGFTAREAEQLRRISMALHRWHELECGTDSFAIVRGKWSDETQTFAYGDDGRPYFEYAGERGRRRYAAIVDRERGALRRLTAILNERNERYQTPKCARRFNSASECTCGRADNRLEFYIQTDPRGAALYILRPYDVPAGEPVQAYYNRGICVS